jgi:Rrf2 family protein
MDAVRISAKADYAVRATVELASGPPGRPVKGDVLSRNQGIPQKFLENILGELRQAGIVDSRRGHDGGYWLARPAAEVTVADVIRAVEGPLASVRGEPPEGVEYAGAAESLQRVWIAVRGALRSVVEEVTLADIAAGRLPAPVAERAEDPDAWVTRRRG